MSADLVQETRLDLSRAAAFLAVVLAAGLGAPALAQPLMPDHGLTTLLRPQPLDRSRPLMSDDRSAATRSGLRQAPSAEAGVCDRARPSAAARATTPAGPSLSSGGSGPGDYGHFLPASPQAADPAGKKAATSSAPATAGGDRPLYSGNDRPLWGTGERRAAPAQGKQAAPGEDASGSAKDQVPSTIPTPVRDRPLWAMRDAPDPAEPAGIGAGPCTASSAPLLPP